MPAKVNPLPHSQKLIWSSTTNVDGTPRHTTPVLQPGVTVALTTRQVARGILESLPHSFGKMAMQSMAPRQKVKAEVFSALRRIENAQQEVHRFVPMNPNVLSNVVASQGEAVARYEMAEGNMLASGQYSRGVALNGAASGSVVCTHGNNLFYRALVAFEQERAVQARIARLRANAPGLLPFRPKPISLAVNRLPHVFVMWGDPRESDDVVTGNIWGTIPIVTSWKNTTYSGLDYSIRDQFLPGASSDASLSLTLEEIAEAAARRPALRVVNEYLQAHDRPPVGPVLLASILQHCKDGRMKLNDVWTMAVDPGLIYEGPEGELMVPTIEVGPYQAHRAALADPAFEKFKELDKDPDPVD